MRLFVSYARVDRPFCEQIVRTLETAHDVWYDRRLHAGKKWWNQILQRLDWCEGFVYLLSPESVESEYCQNEYAIARDSGKLIFPVKIQSNTIIPAELLEIQVVDFSEGLTPEAVALLMAGINIAEVERARHTLPSLPGRVEDPVIENSEGSAAFAIALDAYNAGRLDEALFKLMQVRESGYDTGRFVNLDSMVEEVQTALERQAYLREAERSYAPIAHMVSVAATRSQGCEAFAEFQHEFPDYDPQNVAEQCARHRQQRERDHVRQKKKAARRQTRLPRLDEPRAIIIAAIITGVLGIVGAVIGTGLLGSGGGSRTTTPAPDVPSASAATEGAEQPDEQAPAAPVPEVEASPTPEPMADPAIALALAGVSSNAEWTPYVQELGGVEMALVPAGCFMMGSEDDGSNEQPVHEVCFEEAYWIDVTEVTNAQFGSASEGCLERSSVDDQPRICVDWFDALAHCEGRGARLPTEAEWEYAARGPDGLTYPWGNDFVGDKVVYKDNSGDQTAEVGSRPGGVSWVGAYDMSGNVWEWVADWYDDGYYGALADGVLSPQGPDSGEYRVLRGSSWYTDSSYLRAADRVGDDPGLANGLIGFRCARSF